MPAKTRAEANAQQRKWYRRHKKQHIARVREYARRVHEQFVKYKSSCRCSCGESDIRCLDFHHRDPKTKKFNIADRCNRLSVRALWAELKKCDVLCANCHRKKTLKRPVVLTGNTSAFVMDVGTAGLANLIAR